MFIYINNKLLGKMINYLMFNKNISLNVFPTNRDSYQIEYEIIKDDNEIYFEIEVYIDGEIDIYVQKNSEDNEFDKIRGFNQFRRIVDRFII